MDVLLGTIDLCGVGVANTDGRGAYDAAVKRSEVV
jgi:hypothetical protein